MESAITILNADHHVDSKTNLDFICLLEMCCKLIMRMQDVDNAADDEDCER